MKPILLKTTNTPNHSFQIEDRTGFRFHYPYHFHSDYELTLILNGKGTRFVGNNISSFDARDLVLLGENLPHYWHSDPIAHTNPHDMPVRAIVLKFPAEFNGIRLFDLPEHYAIKQLLHSAAKGVKINDSTCAEVGQLMEMLLNADGSKRIILLLCILDIISRSADTELICNSDHTHYITEHEMDRMNKVYEYILQNYLGQVSLSKAAALANMHESAFCKYFKRRYGKTFIQVVSEVRINDACRKLNNSDIHVSEVCYQSGFNNLSNFTKMFRRIMGLSPKEYQRKMSSPQGPTPTLSRREGEIE